MSEAEAFDADADALLARIVRLFDGLPLEVIGAVLTDLAAQWVCRHGDDDGLHDELLEMHDRHVRELVALYREKVDD